MKRRRWRGQERLKSGKSEKTEQETEQETEEEVVREGLIRQTDTYL